jgi:N-acetylglucosaminyl-diphospho-decaprenol L-rhamnosyltransferase
MKLAVIIVNYNTREMLRRCLTELAPHATRLAAQIIVVDNASTDGSVAMLQSDFPQVQVIVNRENIGFARANNQAIQATDPEFVLLLNSDAFPIDKTLDILLDTIESDPQIAVVGPRMYDGNGKLLASAHAFETLPRLAVATFRVQTLALALLKTCGALLGGRSANQHLQNFTAQEPIDTDWMSGACLLLRRAAIDKVGMLDERYFMYMEDEDWCRRFKDSGFRNVYVPAAELTHLVAGSSGTRAPNARHYHHSRCIYHRAHSGILYPAFWLLSALDCAVRCFMAHGSHDDNRQQANQPLVVTEKAER